MHRVSRRNAVSNGVDIGCEMVYDRASIRTHRISYILPQDGFSGQLDGVKWLLKGGRSRQMVMQALYQYAPRHV